MRIYGCYLEQGDAAIQVEHRNMVASIFADGANHDLRFTRSIWPRFADRYEGDGYVLTIDPEAFLETPSGLRRGPCL